jgi:DNA invertase Pin-like site-specific DNA recombinase
LIRERTLAGLQAARVRGRVGGRKRLMDEKKVQIAKSLHADGKATVSEICETLNVSKATLYRSLKLPKAA